ncbi:hypothetical protein [Clostridium sp. DL1XJH146]
MENKKYLYVFKEKYKTDIFLGIILIIITYSLFRRYTIYALLGMAIALLSFISNEFVTVRLFQWKKVNYRFLIVIFYYLRIFIIALIGFWFFIEEPYSVFFFLAGIFVHYMSLVLYYIFK